MESYKTTKGPKGVMDKSSNKQQEYKEEVGTNTVGTSPALLMITLNVNGLTVPVKRQILPQRIKNHDSTICHLEEIHFKYRYT